MANRIWSISSEMEMFGKALDMLIKLEDSCAIGGRQTCAKVVFCLCCRSCVLGVEEEKSVRYMFDDCGFIFVGTSLNPSCFGWSFWWFFFFLLISPHIPLAGLQIFSVGVWFLCSVVGWTWFCRGAASLFVLVGSVLQKGEIAQPDFKGSWKGVHSQLQIETPSSSQALRGKRNPFPLPPISCFAFSTSSSLWQHKACNSIWGGGETNNTKNPRVIFLSPQKGVRELGTAPAPESQELYHLFEGHFRTTIIGFFEDFCVKCWSQLAFLGFQFLLN